MTKGILCNECSFTLCKSFGSHCYGVVCKCNKRSPNCCFEGFTVCMCCGVRLCNECEIIREKICKSCFYEKYRM